MNNCSVIEKINLAVLEFYVIIKIYAEPSFWTTLLILANLMLGS